MKKILCILLVACSINAIAQEQLNEGMVSSVMKMSSTNQDVQAQLAMIGDINSTTYFKNNKTRTEVNNPMTGESVNIIDTEAKKMLVMMNNPMAGGKVYTQQDIEPSEEDMSKIEITKGDETKMILGYECQEYNITLNQDGTEMKMDIFSTEKIQAANQQTTKLGKEFKGFPMFMKITMNQMGMDIVMTNEVIEVKKDAVADEKFDMTPPEGYKKVDKLQGM